MKDAQKLIDLHDLKFHDQIRDLAVDDLVKISRFYPLVRQIIASTAFNYPKLFFAVEEEEGSQITTVLERASEKLLNLMDAKPQVHQAIFDALFFGVGWLRIDYNPPGDDMIPPYVTNDAMHEDLTAVTRVPPGFVYLDPMTPPHKMGDARYIRERMWVPLEALKDDPNVKNKSQIKATSPGKIEELGFGEVMGNQTESPEAQAVRASVENGDFVLVDRVHDRRNRRLIMFADGVDEEIQDIPHPFRKVSFPVMQDLFGNTMTDEMGQPMLDLTDEQDAPGWLVEDGFPFVPVKFDLNASSFYPKAHLKYVEDIQNGIVESMSRQANLLKRTARQGVVNKQETLQNPDLLDNLRKGVDGQWHDVEDISNFKELVYGDVPSDQLRYEDRLLHYEEEITRVTDLESQGTPRTATEAALLGAQVSTNREWMIAKVADVFVAVVRNCFQILGDPRYTPENFAVNVAPNGQAPLMEALRGADFLWEYRISVQAGSTQPLFEQLQNDKFLAFWDRASQRPNFDQRELDRMLAGSVDMVDMEKVMQTDINPEAQRAAQLENQRMISQMQDPGVVQGQDHRAHIKAHQEFQNDPSFQQLIQQAQQTNMSLQPVNPQIVHRVQQISQMVQQHIAMHEQALQQEAQQFTGGGRAQENPQLGIESAVRAGGQNVANAAAMEADTV